MPDVLEPPVPAAPSTLSPTPSSPTMDAFDQTFNDLEPSATTPQTPNAPVPETTRSVPAKDPATGKFTKEVPKDTGKANEPTPKPQVPSEPKVDRPAGGGAVGEFQPPQVVKPSELKQWAKRMGTRAEQAEQQLAQVNRKLKDIESRPQTSVDVQAVTAELAATKKRLEEYEGELKVTRYERSGEYKEKYVKPYNSAWQDAYNVVGELLVTVPNPEDPENPQERAATKQDFDEVYDQKLGPGSKLARAKFGDAAPLVMQHVQSIKALARAATQAVTENAGKATEYEQQQTAKQTLEQQGRTLMYNQAIQAIAQKYPDLFGEREGDTKWNEALAKGRHMADLAFSDRQGLTPEQSVILDAQIHARISGYPGVKAERDQFKAERDALKKELEDIRSSGPGKPAAGSVKGEAKHLTIEQAFDEAVPE